MKMINFLCLMFLATSACASAAERDSSVLWHRVTGSENHRVWLIANEEAAFIKGKIGDWLPIALVETESGKTFLWDVTKVERRDNRIAISLAFDFGSIKKTYEVSYFDKGSDSSLDAIVFESDDQIRISIICGDGSKRDIVIGGSKDLYELKSKYLVSKAMPLWAWENSKLIKAE